jgi:hypothetical protein
MLFHLPPNSYLFLWTAAGLVALWTCGPSVLEWLGFRKIFMEGHDDPSAAEPGEDPAYNAVVAELKALGFEPLGVETTRMWFTGFRWTKRFRELLLATRQRDVIAALYRLVPGEPWRLCFATAFTDGSMVQSGHQMNQLKLERGDYLRWGCATISRAELLQMHRDVSEQFQTKGRRTTASLNPALYAELDRRHSEASLNRDFKNLPLQCLSATLTHLLLLALFAGIRFGWESVFVPLGVIVGGAFHLVMLSGRFRQAATQIRAEDQQEATEEMQKA